jgi:hypothetical protein
VVVCSIALPGTAALFGADTVTGTSSPVNMYAGELFGAFRVWLYDEGCAPITTWSTAFVGGTMTGLASPNGVAGVYWAINPGGTADLYTLGVGVATGVSIPLVATGLLGSAVVDDNQAGEVLCVNDIVADAYTCVDSTVAGGGAFICSFANSDNTGSGAFGNGNGDAVAPGDCSGQTLVQGTGTIAEAQVTRVGQYDCTGADAACTDRWSVAAFSTFTNGIEEFDLGGIRTLHMLDNAGSNVFILQQPVGISDCQDIDGDMDLVYCNASQGGANFSVDVDTTSTLSVAAHKTGAGNGKFVHQMWAGEPDGTTVTALFDLGNSCHDFLGGAVANYNNVGKTNIVGASNYFGTGISDPGKAPIFIITQAAIDTANLAAGSKWTHQQIALNASASSKKGGSLSNALIMSMQ